VDLSLPDETIFFHFKFHHIRIFTYLAVTILPHIHPSMTGPQEGTIGDDLVVKPVPASVRQHLDSRKDPRDDDEAFLDEEVAEDVAVTDGFPLHLPPRHHHIVYRRSVQDTVDMSDYGQ
jgi:hypothetical protein